MPIQRAQIRSQRLRWPMTRRCRRAVPLPIRRRGHRRPPAGTPDARAGTSRLAPSPRRRPSGVVRGDRGAPAHLVRRRSDHAPRPAPRDRQPPQPPGPRRRPRAGTPAAAGRHRPTNSGWASGARHQAVEHWQSPPAARRRGPRPHRRRTGAGGRARQPPRRFERASGVRPGRNERATPYEAEPVGKPSALATLAPAAAIEQEEHHHRERRQDALEHGPARCLEQVDRFRLGHLDLARTRRG